MEEEKNKLETTVSEVDINIDELFPLGDSVLLPEEEKKTVFTQEQVDTSFLDDSGEPSTKEQKEEIKETIEELDSLISNQEEGTKTTKKEKDALYDLASKMIEEGTLIPFEDDKDLSDYSVKDFRELFEANFQEKERKIKEEIPAEFFKSLPEELQVAAKYVADGGQDLKGLFKTLSQVEEIFELDPSKEEDQAEIARQYLHATNFGSAEEIEAEIEDWIDLNKLEQKANQFKPKLDKMQEKIIQHKLAEQEVKKQKQEVAAKNYMDNVYETLVKGELGGTKLDKKTQNMLYSGLVQPSYPSVSGRPTNLLGHLLEKYQFVEPRHDLIAEALWLLSDPDGYKSKLKAQGSVQAVEDTVRKLKTEESRKTVTSSQEDYTDKTKPNSKKQTIQKQGNFFRRF
jgi:hypothetical protein